MMNKLVVSKKRILFFLAILAAVLWFLRGYFLPSRSVAAPVITVTAGEVVQQDVVLTTRAIGNVQPYATVSVRSRVEGQLMAIGFKEGDDVKEGQLLFELDPHPYQVVLDQAKANLARSQAQLDNLKKSLNRYQQLVSKGYVSKQDYDAAEANMKAQAAVVQADKAAVKSAELNLSYCNIHAPVGGRTGGVLVSQGSLVKVNEGTPLVVINQVKPIYVTFSLPEQQLPDVKNEKKDGDVVVNIQSKWAAKTWQAKLTFIDNAVDKNTGMIQLKALYPNDDEALWPGQYVDVIVPTKKLKQAMLVPTRAIQEGPDGSYVFALNQTLQVSLKPVIVGPVLGEKTIVTHLARGEKVVTAGQSQLVDGSVVRLVAMP